MERNIGNELKFSPTIDTRLLKEAGVSLSSTNTIFPGFCDVHVHFREPGFSYKETIATGSLAAAHGGYTAVCTMPNLDPVADSVEHLKEQQDIIDRDACINVYPYAAITVEQKGEKLADLGGMADKCIAFSDDGHGVQSDDMMREAMLKANKINFYGVGDAYVVCLLANMKLCRMGVNSSAHSDVVLQLNSAAELKPGDVAFAISYEGRSKNVLEAIRIAKSKGATVICVTKMNKSPLVKLSDIVLYISTNDLTVGRDKVLRRVADQAIVDALIVGMTIRKPREYRPHIKMVQEAIDCNKVK